ncbi:MAG: hypothetical protein A3D67_02875 [Candidatus Lloydbacteria bacterium RIFCSPHIGHO2_02_FULL_51_22]|uniref:MobA-like NTP transferase domain-containing protein n=2 Tax=Candidatus Lloydiibacteriota TaxID=1817910 RepID=A0A1G2DIN1_9BACT|nr:MAG: hypothetical protein A3D67_02875 [Candidatus Lloydbacteria bacterium RIFCSPHIGHO2_02_FULL_51_22]OGZ15153.1 MAG: hypothetical protein A3J08_02735 [Candidatus Lloydbacteria bacterium RIFCSPLOWO2_02_FULL_51_11]
MSNLNVIILAAGIGKRMMSLTKNCPKPLLSVAGKPIIAHMIEFVRSVGAEKIIVVGGYYFQKLKKEIAIIGVSAEVVNNPDYTFQNLSSFQKGLHAVKDDTNLLVCDADYIFQESTARAVRAQARNISVYCSYDLSSADKDRMRVRSQGRKVLEMSKKIEDYDALYTGIFFIPQRALPLTREIVEYILKTQNPLEVRVESIFGELLRRGEAVSVRDVGPANWFEFDTPEDLEKARRALEV